MRSDGLAFSILRVESEAAFRAGLIDFAPDLILSDNKLPTFDGLSGLKIARQLSPETPVIFVSGTIGEERAVELLKQGATDYVLKDGRARLAPAVRRAMREVSELRERKRAEQKYRDIIRNAVIGIYQTTPDGRYLTANAALARIHGFDSPEELIVWNFGAQIYVDPARREEFVRQLEARGKVRNFEAQVYRKDGSKSWTSQNARTVRDENGAVVCYEAFVEDITQRKELEMQFLRAQRMESIGALAGGIAHDLNNVLLPIIMGIDLLKEMVKSSRELELLDMMELSGKRGADMVKQVLLFARGVEGERALIAPAQLVNELRKIAVDTFPKSISVVVESDENTWRILGDRTQLHQVLLNLCVNARDAMPEGGRLLISARNFRMDEEFIATHPGASPGPAVVLEVSDTGEGMRPDVLGKIFDPFFTTKEIGKGTGLGLSTTLGIIKSHGGFIDVESEVGKGAAFKVIVPVTLNEEEGPADSAVPTAPARGHAELILVIDDEASVRSMTAQTLVAFGYRVVCAENGVDGIAKYSQSPQEFAAVLTDMMMPMMDGAATIRALTRINPEVKIIAVSGLSARAPEAEIASGAVKYFLAKPYTAGTMLKTLSKLLHPHAHGCALN